MGINENLHFDHLNLCSKDQQQQFCRLVQHSLKLTTSAAHLRATSVKETLLFIHFCNVLGCNTMHHSHQPLHRVTTREGVRQEER